MPYQSAGDFLVDVMMNQFNLLDWNYNDDSDLSSFIIPDELIDLIKDYYDIMTDRLRCRILEASPHSRIQCQVGINKKVKQNPQNSFSLSNTYLTM
jgi:hypothetical protein